METAVVDAKQIVEGIAAGKFLQVGETLAQLAVGDAVILLREFDKGGILAEGVIHQADVDQPERAIRLTRVHQAQGTLARSYGRDHILSASGEQLYVRQV